jgi:hypothetical protein
MTELSGREEPRNPQIDEFINPMLLIEYEGRAAELLLDTIPRAGYGWIKYKDGSGEEEVVLEKMTIIAHMETPT